MWNKFPNTPPNIPETEDFGIDYEIKYKLPNGKIETTITEWLWIGKNGKNIKYLTEILRSNGWNVKLKEIKGTYLSL